MTKEKKEKAETGLSEMLLGILPQDGKGMGNKKLLSTLQKQAKGELDVDVDEKVYAETRDALLADGKIAKGRGRGGSIKRA